MPHQPLLRVRQGLWARQVMQAVCAARRAPARSRRGTEEETCGLAHDRPAHLVLQSTLLINKSKLDLMVEPCQQKAVKIQSRDRDLRPGQKYRRTLPQWKQSRHRGCGQLSKQTKIHTCDPATFRLASN